MRRCLPVLVLVCCLAALAVAEEPLRGTPAEDFGLARGSVFDVLVPEAVRLNLSDPGEQAPLPRAFDGAPPLVPHGIADFLPITRRDNLCVDCHAIDEALEGDPTPIPPSHYTDLRRAPGEVSETVAGARWICISCHASPTGAELLVGNRSAAPVPAASAEVDER